MFVKVERNFDNICHNISKIINPKNTLKVFVPCKLLKLSKMCLYQINIYQLFHYKKNNLKALLFSHYAARFKVILEVSRSFLFVGPLTNIMCAFFLCD